MHAWTDGTFGDAVTVHDCTVKFHVSNVYSLTYVVTVCCRKYVEPTVTSHSYGSDEFNMMFFTQVSFPNMSQLRMLKNEIASIQRFSSKCILPPFECMIVVEGKSIVIRILKFEPIS